MPPGCCGSARPCGIARAGVVLFVAMSEMPVARAFASRTSVKGRPGASARRPYHGLRNTRPDHSLGSPASVYCRLQGRHQGKRRWLWPADHQVVSPRVWAAMTFSTTPATRCLRHQNINLVLAQNALVEFQKRADTAIMLACAKPASSACCTESGDGSTRAKSVRRSCSGVKYLSCLAPMVSGMRLPAQVTYRRLRHSWRRIPYRRAVPNPAAGSGCTAGASWSRPPRQSA